MMAASRRRAIMSALLERHGRTYADQAGIRPADKPAPLFQLLVLSLLLSARISSEVATCAGCTRRAAGTRSGSANC
jgi:hypothetical protein